MTREKTQSESSSFRSWRELEWPEGMGRAVPYFNEFDGIESDKVSPNDSLPDPARTARPVERGLIVDDPEEIQEREGTQGGIREGVEEERNARGDEKAVEEYGESLESSVQRNRCWGELEHSCDSRAA